jgi:hypothetical protein
VAPAELAAREVSAELVVQEVPAELDDRAVPEEPVIVRAAAPEPVIVRAAAPEPQTVQVAAVPEHDPVAAQLKTRSAIDRHHRDRAVVPRVEDLAAAAAEIMREPAAIAAGTAWAEAE